MHIALAFSLILASTGIHVDYAFCMGMIDHIELGHHEEHEKSCCDVPCDTDDDCCGEEEIIKEASIDNYTASSIFSIPNYPPAALFNSTTNYLHSPTQEGKSFKDQQRPPPNYRQSLVYKQSFLC
jgi:hypothetical protein